MKNTVEKRLQALLNLQAIDCELDGITKIRGALPEEVDALEGEIEEFQKILQGTEADLTEIEESIALQRAKAREAEVLAKKYEEQQMEVRNNREYDAITKEIDLQKLEIQLSEKKVKSAYEKIDKQKLEIEQQKLLIEKKQQLLEDKKGELHNLVSESEGDERKLYEKRNKVAQHVEDSLMKTYDRIRKNVRNKLAVVTVQRDACGGCFNIVPPQRQADIREKKHIVVCEHCGRIIADAAAPPPPDEDDVQPSS